VTIKFNFYDIYGFALPGSLLIVVLWLPFGLVEGRWPDAEFSSALLGVILAYIAGHIMQTVAQNSIPSNFLDGRFPSAVFLDNGAGPFTREFRLRLAGQIKRAFDLDIAPDVSGPAADAVRSDAFFLCRSALIKSKTVIYAEQFEGLYALMRGLSTAFAVGVVYCLGWAYSGQLQFLKFGFMTSAKLSGVVALAAIIVALFASIRKRDKRAKRVMIGALLVAIFATGYYLGLPRLGVSEHRNQLIAAAVFSFFASERCYSGYKAFAQEFAKAVYRDFSNYEKPPEVQAPPVNDTAVAE
jgi:drug/metabolite transporter (DMT)-like permease